MPFTCTLLVVVGVAVMRSLELAAMARLPLTVSVPALPSVPGMSVPPPFTVTLPTRPVPPSVPPELTVVGDTMEPFTIR